MCLGENGMGLNKSSCLERVSRRKKASVQITLVTSSQKTSLMVHLVVKNLPMTQVPSLVQECSICCRATKPVYHTLSLCSRACRPQHLKPPQLRASAAQPERPPHREARTPQPESGAPCHSQRRLMCGRGDLAQPRVNT